MEEESLLGGKKSQPVYLGKAIWKKRCTSWALSLFNVEGRGN